jgi:hypothetical protein
MSPTITRNKGQICRKLWPRCLDAVKYSVKTKLIRFPTLHDSHRHVLHSRRFSSCEFIIFVIK